MADESLIGQIGEVVVRVRGNDLPGEIIATSQGVPEKFIAYAEEPLECGSSVLVVSVRGPRQVDVVAWSS